MSFDILFKMSTCGTRIYFIFNKRFLALSSRIIDKRGTLFHTFKKYYARIKVWEWRITYYYHYYYIVFYCIHEVHNSHVYR